MAKTKSPNTAKKQLTRFDVSSYESSLNEEIFTETLGCKGTGVFHKDKINSIAKITGKRCFLFSSSDILDANTKSVLSHLRLISNEESQAITAFDVLRKDADVDYEFVQQFGKAITESHEPVLIVFKGNSILGILTTGISINSHMKSYMSGLAITFIEKRGHIISSMQGDFGKYIASSPNVKYYVFEPVA